jgi:hypothetical protein
LVSSGAPRVPAVVAGFMAVQALEVGAVALAGSFVSVEALFVVIFSTVRSTTDIALNGVLAQSACP